MLHWSYQANNLACVLQQPSICGQDEYFSLSLSLLRGVCRTLHETGYLTLGSETASLYRSLYGQTLSQEAPVTPLPLHPKRTGNHATNWHTPTNSGPSIGAPVIPAIGTPVVPPAADYTPYKPLTIGQSAISWDTQKTWPQWALKPTHVTAHSPAYISVSGNVTINVYGK